MPFTQQDYFELDSRYVKKDDCDKTQSDVGKRMNTYEKDYAVLITKVNTLTKILTMIAVPVLAIACKLLFGGA